MASFDYRKDAGRKEYSDRTQDSLQSSLSSTLFKSVFYEWNFIIYEDNLYILLYSFLTTYQ